MSIYIRYELKDGNTLLIETDEPEGNVVKVARESGNVIISASTKFQEALHSAKASTIALLDELNDLPIEEMEITFGLKSVGEAGLFAVGKIGMEANYQITLKWKKPETPK